MIRIRKVWIFYLAAFLLISQSGLSQKTTFNPEIGIQAFYNSNVTYVEEDGPSDSWVRFWIVLPLRREYRRSSYTLSYSPAFSKYSEFSELDNVGHRLSLNLQATPSARSNFYLQTALTLTQDQGDPQGEETSNLFLSQRSTRRIASLDTRYEGRLASKWEWHGRLRYRDQQFENISGISPDVIDENRDEARGDIGMSRAVSPSTSVGATYGYALFNLEETGEQDSHSLSFLIRHSFQGESSLQFSLGVFRWSEIEQPDPVEGSAKYGATGSLLYEKSYRRSDLRIRGYHRPSSGSVGRGTSAESLLQIWLNRKRRGPWGWGIYTNYVRREPRDPARPVIDTVSIGFPFSFRIVRSMRIRITPTYIYQTGVGSLVNLNGGAGFVWYPLENTRIGGGGR